MMKEESLLSPGPVPQPFKDAVIPPFIVVRVERAGGDALLHYTLESGGPPVNVRSKAMHEELPGLVEASVGGWYGTMGQWSLVERYQGVVRCKGVRRMKQVSELGERADFFLERLSWWRGLALTLESEQVGLWQLRCRTVEPGPFSTLVFDRKRHLWVEKREMLGRLGLPVQD